MTRSGGKLNLANVRVTSLDLNLSSLQLSSGSLNPPLVPNFDPKVDSYSVDVPYSVNTLTVNPTASNASGSTVRVGGTEVASGASSVPVTLTGASTSIGITVTSNVYTDIAKTYTVNVNKLNKAPNLDYVNTEAHDAKVQIGWEETMDTSYEKANIYQVNEDQSLTLVDTVAKGKYISTLTGLSNGTAYTYMVKGVYHYDNEAPIESSGVTVSATPKALPARQMEGLNRGLVAMKDGNSVYVGWRMLGTDPESISFNLYRNGVKINQEPITGSTNYEDALGKSDSTYYVIPVLNGNEQNRSETVHVWDMNYLTVPIRKPADGTTPLGEAYSYRANDATVGDLDGDGQYEIVLKWDPTNSKDNSISGYTGNTYVDAYELDGTFKWRIDLGKNIRAGAHYLDVMVYDLDGDGKAEVTFRTADGTIDGQGNVIGDATADHRNASGYILTGPEFHTVFEGATGKMLATDAYEPERGNVGDWGDTYGNRVDRFGAAIAYLDGERPSIVMQRGYYTRMVFVAYNWRDGQLTKLWTFDTKDSGSASYAGQGNHQLSIADIDGDGKDEIVTGAAAINDDGTPLWNSLLGHGDAMHLGDLDPDRLGLELFAVQETTTAAYSSDLKDAKTGRVLWGQPQLGLDVGRGLTADIDPRYKGEEAWNIGGEWNSKAGSLFSAKGEKISTSIPSSNFAIWWDGDLGRELLDHNWLDEPLRVGIPKIDKWNYQTNQLENISTFNGTYSNNDTKGNPALQADILGDWREEVIARTEDSTALRIYSTTEVTDHRIYTLMHDPVYRLGIAWQNTGYNQPPHTSFYLGNGMDAPPKPNIRATEVLASAVMIASPANEIRVGQQLKFSASVIPEAVTNNTVTWSVSQEDGSLTNAATISVDGLLTAVAEGKVKITATANDGSGAIDSVVITIKTSTDTGNTDTPAPTGTSTGSIPPVSPESPTGSIKQVLNVDTSGNAVANIQAADLNKAMKEANGGTVTIELSSATGLKAVEVKLPAASFHSSADPKVQKVEIATGLGTISLDSQWFNDHVSDTSQQVELSVNKVDVSTLSTQVQEQLKGSPVYDFNLTVDGLKVNDFNGHVLVSLDYTLQPGQDAGKIVVYYIDDNGVIQTVTNGFYNAVTGKVVFKPAHFSKYAAAYVQVSFDDISHVGWAQAGIESLAARGVIDGMGDHTFVPDNQVTRAQFLKMLMGAFELADSKATSKLSDVSVGEWYYSSIAAAEKLGIVEGKSDGTFGVNDPISREDMAVMAYRAAELLRLNLKGSASQETFIDNASIARYAVAAVDAMQQGGIIQGDAAHAFEPKNVATRAQSAVIIYRLFQKQQ
ncbi:S-layer homology domain-containing protein [Paenibacillus oryzisoli]|uniref:rhamnogalacturonan lyase family protein n=1 Tax=Paenibacillus oryzisoli TaxID=1850517 RepID=UPI000ADFE70A|nr:S-layer homology domain-containing protein [Paenibacillus oryzisoli]